jgi:hypothetical protein
VNIESPQFAELVGDATSRIDLWGRLLKTLQIGSLAEVGVWKGEFARQMLERCPAIQRYYLIDPWAQLPDWNKPFNVEARAFDEVYAEALKNTEFAADKRVILRGRTKAVVDQIPEQSLDLAYVDGDHTLRGITIDLIKIYSKVKNDGWIGGDDFNNNPFHHDSRYEPTLVCPFAAYFAEAMDVPIVILPFHQFLIQKRPGAGFSLIDLTGQMGELTLNRLLAGKRRGKISRKIGSALARIGIGRGGDERGARRTNRERGNGSKVGQ